MKRVAYIETDRKVVTRQEVGRPPISVGLSMGGHGSAIQVELTAYSDGRWELTRRETGTRPAVTICEGREQ